MPETQSILAGEGISQMIQATGLILLGVLLVGLVLIAVLRRWWRGGRSHGSERGLLRVVDYVPLGGKRAVVVTRMKDRLLVLGLGSDSVDLLLDFSEEELHDSERTFDRSLRAAASRPPSQMSARSSQAAGSAR